ncbi:MAG: ABC transporter ATP-binding protein [Alphaproteobacteria bacterium]
MSSKKRIKTNIPTFRLIKRLWKAAIKEHFGLILIALFFMIVNAAGEAFSIKMLEPVVDKVFVEKNQALLWPIGFIVISIFAIKSLAAYGQAGLMSLIGLRVINNIQKRLFGHIVIMDNKFFTTNKIGKLVSRCTVDTLMLRTAVSDTLVSIGKDASETFFLVVLMFMQDVRLASVVFFIFPLAFYPLIMLGKRMRKVTINTQEELGQFNTILEQSFHGINIVKAYGMEDYEKKCANDTSDNIMELSYKAAKTRAMSRPLMEFLGGIAITVVIVYGGSRVIDGATTPGGFFAFIGALLTCYRPMKSLANLNVNLQEGLASAERIFNVLDTEPEIQDLPSSKNIDIKEGNISFNNVSFSYGDNIPAVANISFTANKGKTIALVGSSGAGKSTLLNLIPRFYDIDDGAITINDFDIRDLSLASLRKSISLVSQDVTLFDDTVRANILYGKFDASEEDVIKAAKDAAAHEFIMELPYGYNTIVGERGAKLSGGQKQRVAIARAMIKNAPILLLDEATSALDTESERQVQEALETLMKGRTTIVIAHRLSTIINADLIYVIDNGKIVEYGSHDELLTKDNYYAKLYKLQFKND